MDNRKEPDGIVMENPGSIRTGKKQMLKGGISDPRNKALMKMFNMIGIGERAGSGVPDIYSVWENEGWAPPQVVEEFAPDRTILKLSFRPARSKKTAEKSDRKKVTEKTQMQKELIWTPRRRPGRKNGLPGWWSGLIRIYGRRRRETGMGRDNLRSRNMALSSI